MDYTAATAVIRYALDALDRQGVDSGALARRLGLPVWALDDNTARVPLAQLGRLWQFAHAELGDPLFGLRMAAQWQHGRLHLNDYLFEAAGTLGEGLSLAGRNAHLAAEYPDPAMPA